jgi:putative transposase
MNEINKIIDSSLEVKRALCVKMTKLKYSNEEIIELLGVSKFFIEKWRANYNREGAKCLATHYKGSVSYLTKSQQEEVNKYLKAKTTCKLEELIVYLQECYGITFKSKQSYYNLLAKAGMSWKKTEKVNPKKNDELVEIKKEEIKKNSMTENQKYSPGIWSF